MRKIKSVTITAEGRDKGNIFVITEMSARDGDRWATRALGAMARSGIDVPPHIMELGMSGILAMGFKAILGMEFSEAEPLLDDLMACVKRFEDKVPEGRPLVESDIEEILTFSTLRSEVFELHTGFSPAAYLSKQWAAAEERARLAEISRNTPTSDGPSV